MKEQNTNNKGAYIFLFLFVGSIFFYFGAYENIMLNMHGKYTLARYIGTSTGGRQGASDKYAYTFEGKEYYKFISVYDDKRYLTFKFCKFVPSQPSICRILYDIEVPHCITLDNIPKQGLDSLPSGKVCIDDKPPLNRGRVELD